MPLTISKLEMPPEDVSPSDARTHLSKFLKWLEEFFDDIATESGAPGPLANIFAGTQIAHLPGALEELKKDKIFEEAVARTKTMTVSAVREHGLYGKQLQWKISNINYWSEKFLGNILGGVLDRLLDAIDALLDSLLDGVPGAGALKELKEAIRNAIDDE
jgi:hypothetical protein